MFLSVVGARRPAHVAVGLTTKEPVAIMNRCKRSPGGECELFQVSNCLYFCKFMESEESREPYRHRFLSSEQKRSILPGEYLVILLLPGRKNSLRPAVRSKISSKIIFESYVCGTPITRITLCVLNKGIDRSATPLRTIYGVYRACTRVHSNNSVLIGLLCAEAKKKLFLRGTTSDDYGRNALVYHMYPVSRITSAVRVERGVLKGRVCGWRGGGLYLSASFMVAVVDYILINSLA